MLSIMNASFIILSIINFLTYNFKLKLICSKIIDERQKYFTKFLGDKGLKKNKKKINKEKKNKEISLNDNTKKKDSKNLQTNLLEAPPKKIVNKNQTNNLFFIIQQPKQKNDDNYIKERNKPLSLNNNSPKSNNNFQNNRNNIMNKKINTNNDNNNNKNNNINKNNNNIDNNVDKNVNKIKMKNNYIKKNKNNKNILLLKKKTFERKSNYSLISNNFNSNSKILFNKENINYNKNVSNITFLDTFINNCSKNDIYNLFSEEEINDMKFKYALKIDKRDFVTYYISLLKQKQLILFTFFYNDYNLYLMKISLFLCIFTLYLMTNTFFFNDDNMHKIYNDYGKYNFIYQIPQILYSTIISSAITIILKNLSLSQKSIIKIKKINDIHLMIQTFLSFMKCFIYKLILFNLVGLIVLLFNLYYISLFCAVYTNTQSHLLTDTFTSFGISLLYPFGLSIIPGILRISALKSDKNNKKTIYFISQLIGIL